jgi:hydroxyacylglutathione hydrolase
MEAVGNEDREGARADVVLEGEQLSLGAYGIEAELLHTPGHTPGSLSVLLPGGEALVGDLDQAVASWNLLLARGVKTVYPGHGRPFPAARLAELITAGN